MNDTARWASAAIEWEHAAGRLAAALRCYEPRHPMVLAFDQARLDLDFSGFQESL